MNIRDLKQYTNLFSKSKVRLLIVSIMIVVIGVIPIYAITIDSDLDNNILSPNNHFRIYYTNCSVRTVPDKCITDNNASDLGIQLEDIYSIYTDPRGDFRFNDPTRGNVFPIQVLPERRIGFWFCNNAIDCGIKFDPKYIYNNRLSLESIPLHELLHQVQWTYGGWSGLVQEGVARMMQDKLYDDLDQSRGTGNDAYFVEANTFLDASTDNTLIDQAYSGALFWTYFTEQYGAVATEPQIGVDAIRTLFEHYGDGLDDIQRVNAALNILRPGTTFRNVFMDFIVANYAKDLTGPNVPPRYQYIDDNRPPGAYHRPALTLDRNMAVGDIFSATDEIRAWSAKYYEVRPSTNVPIISVDFRQPTASAVTLAYNLLVIKNGDIDMSASEFSVTGKDFVRGIVNRNYDRVVVVVGALDQPAAFRYTISTGGGTPTLNILRPRVGDSAKVDVNALNTYQVHLEVVGPGGVVVSGFKPSDFNVTVGGTNFSVVTGHEVMGQYWLVVQPKALGRGSYDLRVSISTGTLSDTELSAVSFVDKVNVDNVIVIDRSGTMLQPNWTGPYWEQPEPTDKIYGAIDAATLYINSFRTGDKMGLIWFSTDVKTSRSLMDYTEPNRIDFINQVNILDQDETGAWDRTSMGDGLWNAQDELDNRGDAGHDWAILLLSDGLENEPRPIKDVVCDSDICKINTTKAKTRIYTVALGSNADRKKMEKLASQTGGKFEYVIEPDSGDLSKAYKTYGSLRNDAKNVIEPDNGDLPNDLADVYRSFAETVLMEQRIAAIRGEYGYNFLNPNHTINMEDGATEATFVVNYNWKGVPNGGIPSVTLLDPSGNVVQPTYVDDTHRLFRISLPQSGPWTVKLAADCGGELCFSEGKYLIEASVKSKATLEVFLGIPPDERVVGANLPVLAFLTDTQPIAGATIDVKITTPELAIFPSEVNTVHLYDDGQHGDGKANDGVYGGMFSNTNREGIYNMKVTSEGHSSLVGSFKREAKLAFNIRSDKDSDNDGLPDKWEIDHGLDPNSNIDDQGAEGDLDGDGLKNIKEFEIGTKPLDPDTDDGGENDGSESQNGRDPTDPADDQVRPPTSLRAIPGVNSVNLTIGYLPEHDKLIVYRATSPEGPWVSFEISPTSIYNDTGLGNDITYYYKVVGVIQLKKSAPTRVVSATPKADPIPPFGYVVINGGAEKTNTEKVVLTTQADPDTIEMKISNNPELIDANWEDFNKTKNWVLLPGKGLRTVYVLFKDAAGNIGPRSVYDPSVEIQSAMDSILVDSDDVTVTVTTPISACTAISSPGTYVLTQNIVNSTNSICISITSNNVVFDGAGYKIDGVDVTSTYGVYVYNLTTPLKNVTVKNLKVMNWYFGIYYSALNGSITNNTASKNFNGIYLNSASNNSLNGNRVSNNFNGIYLSSSSNNTLSGNNVSKNSNGIYLNSTSNNNLNSNRVSNNDLGIYLSSSSNSTLSGNTVSKNSNGIYLNSTSYNNLNDNRVSNNFNGIYLSTSSNNSLSGNTISKNSNGIHLNSTSNNNLNGNKVSNNFNGIYLSSSSNNRLSGNTVSKNSNGIYLNSTSYNNLNDNRVSNNDLGIHLSFSSNNNLNGNDASNNSNGIYLNSTSNNTLNGNRVSNNDLGIYLSFSSNNNMGGNNVSYNTYGISLYSSSNNKIYHNNIINNANQGMDNTSDNSWDSGYPSGGNYWSDYTGADLNSGLNQDQPGSDGIGDIQYQISGSSSVDKYPLMIPYSASDTIPPEALISFNATTKDIQVTGIDSADSNVKVSSKIIDKNIILYTLTDVAGNVLNLTLRNMNEGKELKASVIDLVYTNKTGEAEKNPAENTFNIEFSTDEARSIKELQQKIDLKELLKSKVNFNYVKGNTIVDIEEKGKPNQEIILPGLVTLRLRTEKGALVVEIDGKFKYIVDSGIIPSQPELPGLSSGPSRPVGVIVGPDGKQDEFVVNEVILHPKSQDDLRAFLDEYNGIVLRDGSPMLIPELEAQQGTLPQSSGWYLIQVDLSRSSLFDIAPNMEVAGLSGQFVFSSQDAAKLAALVSRDTERQINPNFLMHGDVVQEHPDGNGGYLDAERWPWMTEDDDPNTPGDQGLSVGVIHAWQYLKYMGAPYVYVAIIDGGFALDEKTGAPLDNNVDYWTTKPYQMNMITNSAAAGGSSPMKCSGGTICPWHGQGAFGVAAAAPNNSFGSAGTGGYAVRPILVKVDGSFYTIADGIRSAAKYAHVISISISGCDWWCVRFFEFSGFPQLNDAINFATDKGTVVIAAAGNDGKDISLDFLLPCKLPKVICVGAIYSSGDAASYSNYGSGVDIWAPTGIYSTVTPDTVGNTGVNALYKFSGTSASTPFVAGIVGQMKALDWSLRWDSVLAILQDTSNPSNDAKVIPGYVDAYRAVAKVKPNQPPTVKITKPSDGSSVSWGSARFDAEINDPDSAPALDQNYDFGSHVVWSSNRDGQLCIENNVYYKNICRPNRMSLGTHIITATATDPINAAGSDSITINVVNNPLTATINYPPNGLIYYTSSSGQRVNLRGSGYDSDENIPGTNLNWTSNIDGPLGTGNDIWVSLSKGVHTISLEAKDNFGLVDSDSIIVTVENLQPGVGYPIAKILSPPNNWLTEYPNALTLEGQGTDPEDGTLPGSNLLWYSDMDGFLGTGTTLQVVLSITEPPEQTSIDRWHNITLLVKDSDGHQATQEIRVQTYQIR